MCDDGKQLNMKEYRQPLKTANAKKIDHPLEPPEGRHLDFSLVRPISNAAAAVAAKSLQSQVSFSKN